MSWIWSSKETPNPDPFWFGSLKLTPTYAPLELGPCEKLTRLIQSEIDFILPIKIVGQFDMRVDFFFFDPSRMNSIHLSI